VFIVGSAVILLLFALLFWTLRARKNGFAGDSRSDAGMAQVPDIKDPQLRDRFITVAELTRLGLIDLDQQTLIGTLFAPRQAELMTMSVASIEPEPVKQHSIGASSSPKQEERTSVNGALGKSAIVPGSPAGQWVDSVLNRVETLRDLPDGWLNGEGVSLDPRVLTLGYAIGSRLSVTVAEPVGIFPTIEGGMQFEWTRASGSLVTIRILHDLTVEFAVTDEEDEESRQEIIDGQDVVLFVREIVETVG
jgi:hypothetical protein